MKHFKSERLKKLESELNDLEQWLKLGLVPKRDIDKHKEEISIIIEKIDEEKERLQFLREGGEAEDYVAPKKAQNRAAYTEMPTLPDVDAGETQTASYNDTNYTQGTDATNHDETQIEGEYTESDATSFDDDESYFSEKNRWKRIEEIRGPDDDEW